MMSTNANYAIFVSFNERGYWSKPYTYKSDVEYPLNSAVVVPTGNFFSVGKVKGVVKDAVFDAEIKYKFIICEVPKDDDRNN
jgi:hypothetical protein